MADDNIYKHFAMPGEVAAMRQRYERGGFRYGEVKQELFDVLERNFGVVRTQYDAYIKDRPFLEKMLLEGAEKARAELTWEASAAAHLELYRELL